MANFTVAVTDAGLALTAQALAGGQAITFTALQMGSGSYTGGDLSQATELLQLEHELELTSVMRSGNQVTVKATLAFRTVLTGFTWREIGLMAQNPAGGEDILYAYGYAGDQSDYIPGASEATLNERVIQLTVLVAEAAEVTAVVDGSVIYAEYSDLEALREDLEGDISNIVNVIQQVTGVNPDTPPAQLPSGSMVVTLTHSKSGTAHAFTGLGERTGLVPCQFKATAGYAAGDTATIDGYPYTIQLTGADAPETDLFVSGKSILVDVDTGGKTINFKAGGGLTQAKLALATATEAQVFSGKTFYAGSKTLRTGTALSQAVNVNANNIPSGVTAYNQAGQRITGNGSQVFKYETGSCFLNGSTEYISCNFTIKVLALYGGSWLSDCVQIGNGSTTFYKCPDSDFIGQENYQGKITVSGTSASIWYNAGDGCSIYYVACGV